MFNYDDRQQNFAASLVSYRKVTLDIFKEH